MITSSHNPKIKLIRALAGRPKERRENGAFLAEGVRLVEEAFSAGWDFRFVLYTDGLGPRGQDLVKSLTAKGVDVEPVVENLFQSMTETENLAGNYCGARARPARAPFSPRQTGFCAHPRPDPRPRQPGHAAAHCRGGRCAGGLHPAGDDRSLCAQGGAGRDGCPLPAADPVR